MSAPTRPSKDFRASNDPAWQPYRNAEGEVVTLTPDHCAAIYQALHIYALVSEKEGRPTFDVSTAMDIFHWIHAKSCLMGRLLYEGKPPLVDAPPTLWAAPNYSLEVPREE